MQKNIKCTEEIKLKDLWLLVTTSPIHDSEGQILGSAHIAQDITELKEAEKKIQETIKLKDLLIKETHHRVKNNLITISGLLFLQSQHIEDPDAKKGFIRLSKSCKSHGTYTSKTLQSRKFRKHKFEIITLNNS